MSEVIDNVVSEIYGAWRFRWWGMLLAWLVAIGGWGFISFMPDVFEARAQVLVNTNTDLREIFESQGLTIPPDIISEVEQVRLAMLGGPQLEKVARQTDMHLSVVTEAEMESLIRGMRRNISISGGGGNSRNRSAKDNLFSIAYKHPSREKAIEVVNTLLNILVEDTLGASRSGSESSIEILREQQSKSEARLVEAENRLRDFRRDNAGFMPDERGGYFTRLQSTEASLREANRERDLKQRELQNIGEQLQNERPVLGNSAAVLPENGIEARIQRLETEIDELLIRFTEKHPEIVAKRETLENLHQKRADELVALGDGGEDLGDAVSANPVHQQLRIERNRVEIEIGRLDVTISDFEDQIAQLVTMRERAIEVETSLAQLDRDYEIIQGQYTDITQALEQARLSDDVVGPVQFQVIEPPGADFEPVAPDRPILLLLCLAGALGAGGGFAFLLHQLRPVFNSGDELRRDIGLPVLGSISMAWREEFRGKTVRESFAFGIAGVGLIGVCALALTLSAIGIFPIS